MMKKRVTLIVALFSLSVMLFGCGANDETEKDTSPSASDKNIVGSENNISDTTNNVEQEELFDYYVPVKETTYREKELRSYKVYEYDINGNIIKIISYTKDGTVSESECYEYDENNKLISKVCYNDKDELMKKYEYEYYEDGSIKKETVSTSDYVLYFYEYVYNENGSIRKKTFYEDGCYRYSDYEYNEKGDLSKITLLYVMNKMQETYVTTYEYETENVEEGQRIYTFEYNNGELSNKTWCTYDSAGMLIEEGEVLENYGEHIIHRYIYDEQGRIVTDFSDTSYDEIYTYEYDENGNVVKRERIDMSHSFIHTTWLYTTEYECIKVNKETYERLKAIQD